LIPKRVKKSVHGVVTPKNDLKIWSQVSG
jgi:hypothetical protein